MHFAIVGAAVRLPDANDITEFWSHLRAGDVSVKELTRSQSATTGINPATFDHPNYVPYGTVLEDASTLDTKHFGITAGDASLIDPQQRMLLKLGTEALQTAGIDSSTTTVGTFVSTTTSTYLMNRIIPARGFDSTSLNYPVLLGNDKDFAGTRLAHKLGLRGPAMTVQTACSSSLVAVHQACSSLALGEVDAALVGGVSISIPQASGYVYTDGGIMSATGQCRPFDVDADGTVKGNGGGAVVLKRLVDAVAQGDHILGVVRGSAVNNDGHDKIGFTAPSVSGQADVITAALSHAGSDSDDVAYVETHGTGTKLGDPIEIRALDRAHRDTRSGDLPTCNIGSLKANYGHLDAAAGIIGLIKAALVLHHREIPPQPNFTEENPSLRLGRTRFRVATAPTTLSSGAAAAVSSFGMGGTNCHIVLTAAPTHTTSAPTQPLPVTVNLRAPSPAALATYRRRLADYLRLCPDLTPADVRATFDRRLERGDHCFSATVTTIEQLTAALAGQDDRHLVAVQTDVDRGDTTAGRFVWLPPTPFDDLEVDLPTMAADPALAPAASTVPTTREDVVTFALGCIREALGVDNADLDADFFDLGGESITLVEIVGDVTTRFGTAVDFDPLDGLTNTGALVHAIADQVVPASEDEPAGEATEHHRFIELAAPANPFYLHPPAGGTNFCYVDLHRDAPELAIKAFRAPKLDAQRSIEDIAARNIALLPTTDTADLRIGGYSFGGNVAIEMALQLERAGRPVAEIVLFDSHVPSSYRGSDVDDSQYTQALDDIFHNATRTDGLTMTGLLARLGENTGNSDVLDAFKQMWRSNHHALTRHRPIGTTSARITVFAAAEQHPPSELALLGITEVPKSEWQSFSTQPIRLIETPGNHYTMFTDPTNRRELARMWRVMFAEYALVGAAS